MSTDQKEENNLIVNLSDKILTKVKNIANRLHKNDHIDRDLKQYLIPKYPTSGLLKGNPKIHKKNNPFQHIVNGQGTATERFAEIAEKELEEFIEDGFGIWTGTVAELEEFQAEVNTIHEKIKVELRWSYESIEFLDVMVMRKEDRLTTGLYVKPTDKHMYVQAKSGHPQNVKKAIPYGLAIRPRRICENEEEYQKHIKDLKQQLRNRGNSSQVHRKTVVGSGWYG
ncbi:hypothetical protein LOTGIDRAFT_161993 [Lottia gigantea]|uniref:Helix-turn-helix domain-containing protein n=1 Tax=Lottia gigantea TaxID=225164 RepID=V4ACY8_LOTGI|nr:hypothetical protein LOTGIDRAFT_161993 [Lottia gigantea]ESO92965.1 hypothetical protein LOTGIDRAFT_161993 [Lottia gigantea]